MLFTSLILGLLSGLILGLFGGGGALFIIPMLTYIFHYSLKTAIASSLFLVTIGSLPSILLYLKNKEIDLHSAFKLGIGGALGAYIAGIISESIESRILFYILILLMGVS